MDYGGKNFVLLWNWVRIVPVLFKIIFATFFFNVRVIGSVEVETLLLFRFLIFHAVIWSEILKMFEEKKI